MRLPSGRPAENDALAWLRRAAAARDRVRVAHGSHGRCYCDPLRCLAPSHTGGGDEKALQSRRQTS